MSSLTLTIIQTDLHWEDKEANLHMLEQKINALKGNSEIVVLPEMFSTGFSMKPELLAEKMEGVTVTWMRRMASEKKIILTGSIMIEIDGHYYNRLIWMLPNGEYGVYDKRHCFAYAGEDKHFTSGNKRLVASVKGWKINLLICYDLRFPVWARQQPQEQSLEYDVLIYVANWPERRIHAWKTLLAARAIENQCYVVGVNRVGKDGNDIIYTGESMIIEPMGQPINQITSGEVECTVTLEKEKLEEVRNKFPFWRDGDRFTILS